MLYIKNINLSTKILKGGDGYMRKCKQSLLIGFLAVSLCVVSSTKTQAEEYQYDALNRVTKVIYDDGSYVEYEYDSNGNLEKTVVHPVKVEDPKEDNQQEQDDPEEKDPEEKPSADNPASSAVREYVPKMTAVISGITAAVYQKLHTGFFVPAVGNLGLFGKMITGIIQLFLRLIQTIR